MQEDGLLHERYDSLRVRDFRAGLLGPTAQLVLQLTGQPLRLTTRQLQRRVLGPVPVPPPGQVVAAQRRGVVLQLHHVQPPSAQHQQVDLMPLAAPIPELEVRQPPERRVRRQQGPDEVEPLRLMRELRRGYLDSALNALRRGPVSSTCPVRRIHRAADPQGIHLARTSYPAGNRCAQTGGPTPRLAIEARRIMRGQRLRSRG